MRHPQGDTGTWWGPSAELPKPTRGCRWVPPGATGALSIAAGLRASLTAGVPLRGYRHPPDLVLPLLGVFSPGEARR